MNKYLVLVIVLGVIYLSSWGSGGSLGASTACENGQCLVSASSSPISVFLSVVLAVFVVFYPQRAYVENESNIVGVWRRFGAFFLDFMLVLMVVSSIGAVPLLVAEAEYTGAFQWAFIREFSRPTDAAYVLPSVFVSFVALFLYFYLHGKSGRPTVGQYVLGYRIASLEEKEKPAYGLRVLLSFLGLCMWPVSVMLAIGNQQKQFWWDSTTRTRVFRVNS